MTQAQPPKYANPVMDFGRLCAHTEVSELFAIWGGLAMVSATLGRRTWLNMGGVFTVFPNLFLVLVASSGLHRKSTVVNLARRIMVVDPPVNFIPTDLTPEALFKAMNRAERKVELPTGTVVRTEGIIVASELATLLNKKSYERGIAPILIDMFDCLETMDKETVKDGKKTIRNVCLSVFAGSTVELLRDAVPKDAVGSGLTSRMLFIYSDEIPTGVARPGLELALEHKITESLQLIRQIEGQAELTPEAWKLYEESYMAHRTHPFMSSSILSGYASRWHYHMLALGMIASAAQHPDHRQVVVEPQHLRWAIALLARSEIHMPRVMRLITSTERGANVEILRMRIGSTGETGISQAALLDGESHRMSMRDFSEAISTLIATKHITSEHGPDGAVYKVRR